MIDDSLSSMFLTLSLLLCTKPIKYIWGGKKETEKLKSNYSQTTNVNEQKMGEGGEACITDKIIIE